MWCRNYPEVGDEPKQIVVGVCDKACTGRLDSARRTWKNYEDNRRTRLAQTDSFLDDVIRELKKYCSAEREKAVLHRRHVYP